MVSQMNSQKRKMMVVGAVLVMVGAAMAGLGLSIGDQTVLVVLPTLGSALLSAGLVAMISTVALSVPRAGAIGGALVAGGTVMAVIGAVSTHPDVTATLAPLGAGLVAAGLVVVLLGAGFAPSRGPEEGLGTGR